ncbi:MAG UNVERIFIED_CONTAM: hypothetical protein LVQ98_06135 [Rickettsiaceae bacterium]|jgi:ribosome-associated toxin RatA of RatAB toxin-antitoxin module
MRRITIDFSVDFEFKSKVLDSIAGPIFKNTAHQMMHAFEKKLRRSMVNTKIVKFA